MQQEVQVERVDEKETRSGNVRYVLRDADGREYTTFRPAIGSEAKRFEGRRARIEFHEEQRGGFTTTKAAPWLLGPDGKRKVKPQEMFDKLKPFQELVAEDIRDGDDEDE